jgi:hypothetical protein
MSEGEAEVEDGGEREEKHFHFSRRLSSLNPDNPLHRRQRFIVRMLK